MQVESRLRTSQRDREAGAPLALTPPNCLTAPVKAQLDKLPLESVTRLSGTDVLGNFSLKKVCRRRRCLSERPRWNSCRGCSAR